MKERTYRYFTGKPLYPFGFGLSYTHFTYSKLELSEEKNSHYFQFNVKNAGNRDGDEVVQLYVRLLKASKDEPRRELKNFERIHLKKGESKKVGLRVREDDLKLWDERTNGYRIYPGEYEITIGGSSEDAQLTCLINIRQ
jgi:beta-glucosidase